MATQIELFLEDQYKQGKLSVEKYNSIKFLYDNISEGQKEYLDNNLNTFKKIDKLEMFLKANARNTNEKTVSDNYVSTNNSIKVAKKSYHVIESSISVLKGVLWLFIIVAIVVGGFLTNFNFFFLISLIPVSLLALLLFAQIQMLEAFKDIAENTNITNLLLRELIDKRE